MSAVDSSIHEFIDVCKKKKELETTIIQYIEQINDASTYVNFLIQTKELRLYIDINSQLCEKKLAIYNKLQNQDLKFLFISALYKHFGLNYVIDIFRVLDTYDFSKYEIINDTDIDTIMELFLNKIEEKYDDDYSFDYASFYENILGMFEHMCKVKKLSICKFIYFYFLGKNSSYISCLVEIAQKYSYNDFLTFVDSRTKKVYA